MTPDSFSDGGSYTSIDKAMEQAEKMIQQGADIIDVGGESTRPGHVQIGDEEEIKRVVPVIREIKKKFDIPVSIDTYKSVVAKAALEAGADLLNDIWGFRYDEKMAELAAEYDVPVCLMHNRDNLDYDDFMAVYDEANGKAVRATRSTSKKQPIETPPTVNTEEVSDSGSEDDSVAEASTADSLAPEVQEAEPVKEEKAEEPKPRTRKKRGE